MQNYNKKTKTWIAIEKKQKNQVKP